MFFTVVSSREDTAGGEVVLVHLELSVPSVKSSMVKPRDKDYNSLEILTMSARLGRFSEKRPTKVCLSIHAHSPQLVCARQQGAF